jgi:transcription antitermination factor NusG
LSKQPLLCRILVEIGSWTRLALEREQEEIRAIWTPRDRAVIVSGEKISLDQGRRWFAVNTQPHLENRALLNLRTQGFCAFLPRRQKTTKHARQFRTVAAPLFPGYLFVAFDLGRERWRAINGTFGVRSLVMAGERPQSVPSGVVEALLAMQDPSGIITFASELKLGQRVRMLAGPFAEMVGRLERLDDVGRVAVLLELLGSQVRVRARAEVLVPA